MDANVWNKKKNLSMWVYTFYDMIAITAGKKINNLQNTPPCVVRFDSSAKLQPSPLNKRNFKNIHHYIRIWHLRVIKILESNFNFTVSCIQVNP